MKTRLVLATLATTSLLAGSAFAADTAMGGITMADHAALIFLVISIVAGFFGFSGVSAAGRRGE